MRFEGFFERCLNILFALQLHKDLVGNGVIAALVFVVASACRKVQQILNMDDLFFQNAVRNQHYGERHRNRFVAELELPFKLPFPFSRGKLGSIGVFPAEHNVAASAQVENTRPRRNARNAFADSGKLCADLRRAVEVLCGIKVVRVYKNSVYGKILFQIVVANQREGVFVEQSDPAVVIQVGILRRKVNNQNYNNAEVACNQRVDEQLAENNAEHQHRVAAEQTYAVTLAEPLPANENRQIRRADVEICADINRLIKLTVVVACCGVDRKNRRRPRGRERKENRSQRRNARDDLVPPSEPVKRPADLGGIGEQSPASYYEREEIEDVNHVHKPQRKARPDLVHLAGHDIRQRHNDVRNHDQQKAVTLTDRQVAAEAVKQDQKKLNRNCRQRKIVVVIAEPMKHFLTSLRAY